METPTSDIIENVFSTQFPRNIKKAKKIGSFINTLTEHKIICIQYLLKKEVSVEYFLYIDPFFEFYIEVSKKKRQDVVYIIVQKIHQDIFEEWIKRTLPK